VKYSPELWAALKKLQNHEFREPIQWGRMPNGDLWIKDAEGNLIGVFPKDVDPVITLRRK
jgi:hypothetical protein